ncbi:hypothetical protein EW146_g729 [Bondarzewia mesenterica]|uniref:Uncharacterized protein n=1 Tax=Bondarzewia mesenterica TaxID=1095465 RepID=A0A4S4M630_9AGAM|nr:hypothetical protein EW146_g729 [Bondarzewia mesenterica]
MPKLSPAELSRMKAEKESQELARRKQQEEAMRQQAVLHAQRMASQNQAQQQVPQQVPNGAARAATAMQHQVPQIRSQVNISQQQRMPAQLPAGTNARISPQQMLVAQQRALAAAASANLAAGAMSASHITPPYASRAATSSPAVPPQSSPPRSSATPNPPRPPSAQQHLGMQQASPNMGQQSVARPAANMAQYFPMANVHGAQFTQEQMEQALRLQSLMVNLSPLLVLLVFFDLTLALDIATATAGKYASHASGRNAERTISSPSLIMPTVTSVTLFFRITCSPILGSTCPMHIVLYEDNTDLMQDNAFKLKEQGEEAQYARQKEQEQLAALHAQSKESKPAKSEMDHDFEGGFGGQEDLEDRYATTSGEH